MDVIAADGQTALRQANLAKAGRLGRQMREATDELIGILSALAYWLDDAEELPPELENDRLSTQIRAIHEKLSAMLAHYQDGKILRGGIRTVLLGLPNAGKSSVMNWLCGMRRSIVTSIAGTTRDVVTEHVKIGEFTLLLSDTAGIRETENEIEAIGIAQAMETLDTADLVLYVVDASLGLTENDRAMLRQCANRKLILLWNKNDLTDINPPETDFPTVCCSAILDEPTDLLKDTLKNLFPQANFGQPVIMNERQFSLLNEAISHVSAAEDLLSAGGEPDLISVDLEIAAKLLSEIEGVNVTQETIDGVFSRFCVGK